MCIMKGKINSRVNIYPVFIHFLLLYFGTPEKYFFVVLWKREWLSKSSLYHKKKNNKIK